MAPNFSHLLNTNMSVQWKQEKFGNVQLFTQVVAETFQNLFFLHKKKWLLQKLVFSQMNF